MLSLGNIHLLIFEGSCNNMDREVLNLLQLMIAHTPLHVFYISVY